MATTRHGAPRQKAPSMADMTDPDYGHLAKSTGDPDEEDAGCAKAPRVLAIPAFPDGESSQIRSHSLRKSG